MELGQPSAGDYRFNCFRLYRIYDIVYKKTVASVPCRKQGRYDPGIDFILYFNIATV
jgi:hypothetical protein